MIILTHSRIQRRGSVPYGTNPMGIWGPLKNSRIRIQESGSVPIHITLDSIRGFGPRPDPDLYAFRIFEGFWQVRIQGSGPGFASHSAALKKFLATILIKYLKIRTIFVWIWTFFRTFWTLYDGMRTSTTKTMTWNNPRGWRTVP
jgi:hypothetical protein